MRNCYFCNQKADFNVINYYCKNCSTNKYIDSIITSFANEYDSNQIYSHIYVTMDLNLYHIRFDLEESVTEIFCNSSKEKTPHKSLSFKTNSLLDINPQNVFDKLKIILVFL